MGLIRKLLGLVVFVLLVMGVSLWFLPSGKIAKIAADQISAQTGRAVTLSGDAKLSVYPVLGVATGPMSIANAEWSKAGPMFQAESLKVGVDLMSLLRGDIRITGLETKSPRILLERARDGRVNWELGVDGVAPAGAGSGKSNALALSLDRALITDAALTYTDHGAGTVRQIDRVDLDLRWPEYRGAAEFDLSLHPAGAAVLVTGRIADLANLIAGGVTQVSVGIKAGGGTLRFEGRGGIAPQAAGLLTVDLGNTGAALAALGLGGADIPEGLGRALAMKADVTLTPDMMLALRDMTLRLDGNALTGAADLRLGGAKPLLNAQLSAAVLDLSALAGGAQGTVASTGWSRARIDASALALLDGEVSLVTGRLSAGGLSFAASRSVITIDNARVVAELRELRGYDGVMTGQLVANNRNGLSVAGDVTAVGVALQGVLGDMMGITRFSGATDAQVSFLSSGSSLDAIMKGLSGKGAIKVGRGTISGIDLDRLIRSGDGSGGTTVFDALGATFTMAAGDLRNDDLLLSLPEVTATGKGRIGLGAQDIDYTVTPTALAVRGGKGLAIPVRIRGPWSNPSISADVKAAIDLNFKEEKKALEDKVKSKANAKIEEKLGVTVKEGQSVEDAVKQKIEAEAAKGLLNLLKKK